jgi:hypothetical protein
MTTDCASFTLTSRLSGGREVPVVAKKTVIAQIEFGVMDEAAIDTVLDYFARATKRFGKCECFDVWRI